MRRRDFFTRMVAGAAAAGFGERAEKLWAAARKRAARPTAEGKQDRIAISSWSFHNYFPPTRDQDTTLPNKSMALLDFPEMIAERFKVHKFEFVAPHFGSTEPSYLAELENRMRRSHSRLINLPVDIQELWTRGGLSDPDNSVRSAAVAASKKWIDVARRLNARSVRCDPGKMDPNNLGPTVRSYKELGAYARSKGIAVIIENHGGVGSEHPEELVKLFKAVGGGLVGALPDFGNFPDEETREKGLKLLFSYARSVCHAKGLEFDMNGNETKFDFKKCVDISKEAKYRGVYSIEYEGLGDPFAGVQKVVDELMRYL